MTSDNNGKPWATDKMNRQEIANIINLQLKKYFKDENKNNGFVIGVYGGYGTGKTFFLNEYMKELDTLKGESYEVAKINIKEVELSSHPITAIMKILKKIINNDNLLKEIFSTGKEVLKNSKFNMGGSFYGVSASVEVDLKDVFDNANKEQDNLNEFKNSLKNALESKKIIICIDELDRCNPNFVVSFIDIITHFFGIENLVFILGVNHSYIEKSIAHVYSKEIATDGEGYLTKFINFSIELPLVLDALIDMYIKTYNINEFKDCFGKSLTVGDDLKLQDYIKELIRNFNISVRLLEKIFIRLRLFLQNYSKIPKFQGFAWYNVNIEYYFYAIRVIVFLSIVYENNSDLFTELYDLHTWQGIINIYSDNNYKIDNINNYMFLSFSSKNHTEERNKTTAKQQVDKGGVQPILDKIHKRFLDSTQINYPYYREKVEEKYFNNNILCLIQLFADICLGTITEKDIPESKYERD